MSETFSQIYQRHSAKYPDVLSLEQLAELLTIPSVNALRIAVMRLPGIFLSTENVDNITLSWRKVQALNGFLAALKFLTGGTETVCQLDN